jgi:Major Facilitator Superfamily.
MAEITKRQSISAFYISYILSAFGYEFIFFIMTVHIYDITKSALNVSIFTVLTFLPKFFSPVCGAVADKFARKHVLGISALTASGLLFFLSFTKDISEIYVLWFFISVALTFIINVRGTLIAEVVPKESYHSGNSVILSLSNSAKILAPLLGGVIALKLQIVVLLYASCIIYAAAAVMSCFIQSENIKGLGDSSNPAGKILDGFKYIKENIYLKYLVYIAFTWRLFLGLQLSLFIIYVKTTLNGNDSQYGFFMTLVGLGSIIGSFVGPWFAKKLKVNGVVLWGILIHYCSFAALGLITNYYFACFVALASFAAFYAALVSLHALRDRSTPSLVRGRVYGSVTGLLTIPGIFSMLVGGYFTEKFSVEPVLLAAGFFAGICLLLITVFLSPFNRAIKTHKKQH